MEPPGDNLSRGRGQPRKCSNSTRRVWSNREEHALIEALHDLVANGWKSENGFRTGYMLKLEEALKAAIPNTDLVANPHINSKITSWKKSYASLVSAQKDNTGVGFNMTINQLEVTDEQWEQVEKKDPAMRGMRLKEWPFFNDWLEIFGKDRAIGDVSEDVGVAAEIMREKRRRQTAFNQECNGENQVNLDEQTHVNIGVSQGNDDGSASTAFTGERGQPSVSNTKKKKKRSDSVDDKLIEVLVDYCRAAGDRIAHIGNRLGHDHDLAQTRRNLFNVLGNIPGLSTTDKLDVTARLGADAPQLEMFMGYPDDAKAAFVQRLLGR